nr:IS4 family transposase [Nostoc sp. ZfuVER08]
MLPKFYQTHLKSQLSTAEYLLLQIMINVLQVIKKVSLEAVANALPIPIEFESRRKKVQRSLSVPNLDIKKIWFPIVIEWLEIYFEPQKIIYLAIDRTNWGCINLFMVSVIWDKRSFPIYYELLPKLGSSNLDEQKRILSQVFPIVKDYNICVLGDREFSSVNLANWLCEQKVYFFLRLKNNHFIERETDIWLELDDLGLYPGISFFLKGVKVTKTKGVRGFKLACKWKRKILGVAPKEGWFILTNMSSLELAIAAYKRRFDIEEMFRDFKKGGYNLEDTNVSDKRLIALILLIAIAYTGATISGQKIKRKGVQKYVGRVKEYGRTTRRHSSFYIGLYGQTWVNFVEQCQDLVTDLIRLSRNKRKYYQRGLRAMELILSVS